VTFERNVAIPVNPFTQRVQDAAAVRLTSRREVGLGFDVGVLAKPTENLSVGASYRHKVRTAFAGDAGFTSIATGNAQLDALVAQSLPAGAVPVTTEIEFPSLLTLGAEYSWGDWVLAADVNLHQWSSFDKLEVTFLGRPELSSVVEQGYRDSQIYRVGLERRWSDAWTLRGGYFFDKTPAPAESVGPILADASRHCAALGATWRRGRLRVEAANWLLFFKERSTEGRNRDGYDGTYKSFAELFAISIGISF
jgi:long-chain fatty acid transport protein